MKRAIILLLISGIMFLAGFFGGRTFENSRNGYHYKFLERKEYASKELGTIEWSSYVESVGTPFALEPEMTMISMGNRTLYKAQRDFQESVPYASSIVLSNNFISWDDGDYHYLLKVDAVSHEKQTGPADQPIDSETNSLSAPGRLN